MADPANFSIISNILYFAYGTNLSPTQLSLRCTHTRSSSNPVAIARLSSYKWFIQRRGCANIKPSPSTSPCASEDEVWGVLYAMHPADVAILDTYEGVDLDASNSKDTRGMTERPTEQGRGRHNKVYLEVDVVRWLVREKEGEDRVRALVYVDEKDTEEGAVRDNYVGRMNRGVREALELGLSKEWVERVVRRWVLEGVEAEEGYVGGENRGL
ncbi:hypothetical protein DPSP01_001041 [Paraphaeosphaeria sporulosa]|uniref:gamma-glutamylcyclotransferase n=1 Tax=Paraphaeosphaeria sporulosa TaxID=1460663 RepID=A0A177C5C7_9PLEO|nr:uncharacterized protein CC84DRAFT_982552 [Paraphaeosphaeria sporulosa]OAG02092.1 hypothetical protein CC84DRAFT_982552 [Paraphaeosphaeria sporulosa]